MKISKFPIYIAAALVAGHSYGAVVLQDSFAPAAQLGAPTDIGGGAFGYQITLNTTTEFSAAGHGKLVMVLSGKDEDGGDLAGAPVTSITYGGVALNQILFHEDGNRVSAGIFYLDNVVSDGTLRIEFADGNQSEFGYGLYALDGLKAGFQDSATMAGSGVPTAATVAVTTSEGFVVQEAVRNNQSFTADGGDDWETLYSYSAQSYVALSQYQVTSASGDYLAPINNTNQFKRVSQAAFEAVPEPSTTALLGLGGLALILRRRK